MKRDKGFYLFIISLIILDQGIKIIIKEYFMESRFVILENIFYFKPHLNTEYSWVNAALNLGLGFYAHIVITVISAIIIFAVYDYIKYNKYNSNITDLLFIFLFSGTICSIIDKIFWGGSLDFIYLKPLFIFDLKDIYITIAEILLIYILLKYWEEIKKFKTKTLIVHSLKRLKHEL